LNALARDISEVVLSDNSSPAVKAPALARRLVKILDGSAAPEEIRKFLASQTSILEHALGGRELRVQSGIRLNATVGDLFVGSYFPTGGTWHWRLIMLGKIRTQENVSSELEHDSAHEVEVRTYDWLVESAVPTG
jgi:hypothetical protein